MYNAIADHHFARSCSAQTERQHYTTPGVHVTPHYPLTERSAPVAWYNADHPALTWFEGHLAPTLRRVARRWMSERGIRGRQIAVRLTVDGRVSVHVHAYSRSAQRRVQALADGLSRRLARTLCAANAGSQGVWAVIVSWGYHPDALAAEDRRRARARAAA